MVRLPSGKLMGAPSLFWDELHMTTAATAPFTDALAAALSDSGTTPPCPSSTAVTDR